MLLKQIYYILKDIRNDLHDAVELLEEMHITSEHMEFNQDSLQRDIEIFADENLSRLENLSVDFEKKTK